MLYGAEIWGTTSPDKDVPGKLSHKDYVCWEYRLALHGDIGRGRPVPAPGVSSSGDAQVLEPIGGDGGGATR